MGADIKALRNIIKSVKSTLHLTKAMGLVASSKIRRAQDARSKSQEYASALSGIVDILSSSTECKKSPYLREGDGDTRLIVIAGDRGLAGGYNVNVFRYVREMLQEIDDTVIYPIGKKACEKYGEKIISSEQFTYEASMELACELCRDFRDGKYKRVGVVFTKYISMISQEPAVTWLLPLTKETKTEEESEESTAQAIFEPDEMSVMEKSVPTYVAGLIYALTRESFACEVVARRSAMDSAGKNASAMIDDLQLKYNRARQGAITQEITEIVAGSGE